jgi:epoxyqueuosine reductase
MILRVKHSKADRRLARPRPGAARLAALAAKVKSWGRELGFQAVGIADTDLSAAEPRLKAWLASGFAGELDYMRRHGTKRTRPPSLVPGTVRVISARMDYRPDAADSLGVLADGSKAFVARYALGRDYHKVLRARLQRLAHRIAEEVGRFGYRVFTDSAPVMEVELARKAGLGWRGKHTLLIARDAGSFFFLGDIYTDLPLPADAPVGEHCGRCKKCIDVCPTRAIVGPYRLDARRCISYLTIELKGSIPAELRPLVGNRVYGCDDCQLVCPWNRYARTTPEPDFRVRNGLDRAELIELFAWTEEEFRTRMAGSAILRIGYERWLRNLAVGLGNAPRSAHATAALRSRVQDRSALVREHVAWALERQEGAREPVRKDSGAMPLPLL